MNYCRWRHQLTGCGDWLNSTPDVSDQSWAVWSQLVSADERLIQKVKWPAVYSFASWRTGWCRRTCALTVASATWRATTVGIRRFHLMPKLTCHVSPTIVQVAYMYSSFHYLVAMTTAGKVLLWSPAFVTMFVTL